MNQRIQTPDRRVRIFVSSTLQELADERSAARSAIQHLRLTPVMFEMGARAHPPRDLYRAYLAQSDVFLGIYWQRYGWVAPGESLSGLEDEYLLARDKPKLIYIKGAETREEPLSALLGRIRQDDTTSYRPFSNAEELRDLIENDLALMLTERFAVAGRDDGADRALDLDAPPPWQTPLERGEIIGRSQLLADITELVQRADVGLVTLTGPGGTGKTRLAVHIAHRLGASFPDGVFYIPLAGVRNAHDVVPLIVSTLEIPTPPAAADPEKRLLAFLRGRRALLVLDNFEHVLEAAVVVARLLAACPRLKVLATSRETLRLRGEHEVHVPPLPHNPGEARTPAMVLFEERAREVRPGFHIDEDNRTAVAELCRRLDALPLAIELAAARVRMLSPQTILQRLDPSLSLLSSARRDLPERHQTLRATIGWSLDLLRPEEQAFFRRLAVFAGAFSEEAAAAVTADTGVAVLDGLTSLVEKSLLVSTEEGDETAFHLLETVREMARERLAAAGEERATRLRHGEALERYLASEHADLLRAGSRQGAHERTMAEMPAAFNALRFAAGPDGDVELAWRLFIRMTYSLLSNAQGSQARAVHEMVARLPRSQDPLRAAIADGMSGRVRAYMWDETAEPLLTSAVAVLEAAGERDFLPSIVIGLGMLVGLRDRARALALFVRAVDLASQAGHTYIEGWARAMVIYFHAGAGATDEAERLAEEAIAISRRQRNDEGAAHALIGRGYVRVQRGDLAAARTAFAEAVALARSRGAAWARCIALVCLCSVAVAAGDHAGARALLEESIHNAIDAGLFTADAMCGALALMLAQAGERERALGVFVAVRPGAEDENGIFALLSDPCGSLHKATREARMLLGDPLPVDPEALDYAAVMQAVLGTPRDGQAVTAA